MEYYEIKSTRKVSQQQIDDIVTTALEGGITYWCDMAFTDSDAGDNWLSEMLTRGASIKLHDSDGNEWHTLTLEELLKALGDMNFDFDNYDAGDADAAVQRAIFGEVIYG